MDAETLRGFLCWATWLNLAVILLQTLALVAARGWIYRLQSRWFPLEEAHFNAIVYGYLAVYKIVWIALFLVPWLALELMR